MKTILVIMLSFFLTGCFQSTLTVKGNSMFTPMLANAIAGAHQSAFCRDDHVGEQRKVKFEKVRGETRTDLRLKCSS